MKVEVALQMIALAVVVYFLTKAILRPNPDTILTAAAISLAGALIIYSLARRPASLEFRRSHAVVALGLVFVVGVLSIAVAMIQSASR